MCGSDTSTISAPASRSHAAPAAIAVDLAGHAVDPVFARDADPQAVYVTADCRLEVRHRQWHRGESRGS